MVDAVRRPPGARAQVLALHGAQLPRGFRRLLPVAAVLRALGQGDRRPRDPRDSRFRDRGAAPLRTPHAPTRGCGACGALGTREIRDFVIEAQRRYGRRTLHNHVSGLRALCRFWMVRGRLKRNPFSGAPLPKLERRLPQFLTEDQVRALLSSPQRLLEGGGCDPFTAWRDRLAMELLYGAGLRVSELVGLNYGGVELREGVARVTGKGRKQRVCPLGRVACAVLERFRDEFTPGARPPCR